MEKLIKFLYGERSRVNSLLIYAIHSDYNSYCTFARRAKITTHELYSSLQLAGIEISQVTNKNMYNEEFHKMVLRELFVQMKQDKVEILKNIKYDFSKNSKN